MTTQSRFGVPGAVLQCASEGNVLPVTSLDRHTGRAALATSDVPIFAENTNGIDAASVDAPQHPAGSRDSNWRSSPADSAALTLAQFNVTEPAGSPLPGLFLRSYSETKCSTRSGYEDGGRPAWLAHVGRLTKAFRAERAMKYRGRARYMLDVGDRKLAEHNLKRADGQLRRFENVAECGEREVLYSCGDCGHAMRCTTQRCSHYRLCLICRGQRARRYRTKFREARQRALEEFRVVFARRWLRTEWRERMLTLTIPHSGDVKRDLKALPTAWKTFRRWLWLFFTSEFRLDKELLSHVAFMRVTETTAGRKSDGHAHYHVYFHSPYIPHELARHLWGKALEKLGYETPMRPIADVLADASSEFAASQLRRVLATRRGARRLPDQIAWPVVDIEEAYGNIESELVKYLVKDSEYEEGAMKLISPELYARIYEGMEGVRTIASSRGFFPNERGTCSCDQCGSTRITRSVSRMPTIENVVLLQTTSAGGSETP